MVKMKIGYMHFLHVRKETHWCCKCRNFYHINLLVSPISIIFSATCLPSAWKEGQKICLLWASYWTQLSWSALLHAFILKFINEKAYDVQLEKLAGFRAILADKLFLYC